MGARWYDSRTGRWLSPDTEIPDARNPQTLNRMAYVHNNPFRYVDPTGHQIEVVWQIFDWAITTYGGGAAGTWYASRSGTRDIDWEYYGRNLEDNLRTMFQVGDPSTLPQRLLAAHVQQDPLWSGALLLAANFYGLHLAKESRGAVVSMGDHLSFLFGEPQMGFPGRDDRHKKEPNDPKVNVRHIREALKAIIKNMGRSDLQTYLVQKVGLSPKEAVTILKGLGDLAGNLKNEYYPYSEIGPEAAQEVLQLLNQLGITGY